MKLGAPILGLVGAALALLGCSAEQKPLNVLLISVDTLRPDRLGFAGNPRPTSPTIDALASEGIVFSNCYSVSGWTLPSMATIFTGLYPRDHGATDFHWSIDPGLPTMASILRRHGYDTHGFVSHVILKPGYGLAEGFKSYDFSVLNTGHPHDVATAEPLTDLVLEGVRALEEPYFLWVHYFDPHFAYLSHPKWRAFGDRDIDRYDQEIAHTDEQIGRVLSALERRNLLDNTMIIFTSDHGEEFGEHEGKYHYTLFDEVLRSPLIIKMPGAPPRVDETMVEQIDFLPTVLAALDIDPGDEVVLPGRDILDSVSPPATDPRPLFMERDRPPPYNQRSMIMGHYKLNVVAEADTADIPLASRGTYSEVTNVVPGIYLYDLAADPGETQNIFSENDSHARELLVRLAEHFSTQSPPTHEVQIDETLREKLRSLGYID